MFFKHTKHFVILGIGPVVYCTASMLFSHIAFKLIRRISTLGKLMLIIFVM